VSLAATQIPIQAWWILLDHLPPQPNWCSQDELQRAERMLAQVRQRFLASRTALRYTLGQATHQAPEDLSFAYGPHGKPWLPQFPQIHFNLSHSQGLGFLAIAPCPIGVDVEQIELHRSAVEIAARFFPPREAEYLTRLEPLDRQRAFLCSWVAKEALLKGSGLGLAGELTKLEFDHRRQTLDGQGSAGWHLQILERPGAIAAVATPTAMPITLRNFPLPSWEP
jgi:4'-phosphopantetheinyl transferase